MERKDDPTLRVTTEAMSYGPHAVARHEGKVLFVRGAAPDEEVDVVVRERRRSFDFADVARVVRASAARRTAACEYLPQCGGCPWQHLHYDAQLEAKRSLVREQLRRIAGMDVPVAPPLPSPLEFGYRHRLKLRVEGGEVGFFAGGTHELVAVRHCLIGDASVDRAIAAVAELMRGMHSRARRVEIVVGSAPRGGCLVAVEVEGSWLDDDEDDCRMWLENRPSIDGLVVAGRRWRKSWGRTGIEVEGPGAGVTTVHAGTFTQVNPAANRLLVETIVALAGDVSGRAVLDLYSGAGNLSLPLACLGADVLAVERSRQAASDAIEGARRLGLERYRVFCARSERAIAELIEAGEPFDVVVLDPPRSGAAGLIEPLLRLRPKRILYVSCEPSTLARDLRALGAAYEVDVVQPVDLFPQTYHVETVTRAILTCSR